MRYLVQARRVATIRNEERAMSDEQRIAEELDRRVAERTRELTEANEALQKELVAERERTEAARRANDHDARVILASIPGLVSSLTPTGDIDFVNDRLLEYYGRTREELQQWKANDTVHPDDLPGVRQVFTRAMGSGEAFDLEIRLRRFDGVYRWFQIRVRPHRNASGALIGWHF